MSSRIALTFMVQVHLQVCIFLAVYSQRSLDVTGRSSGRILLTPDVQSSVCLRDPRIDFSSNYHTPSGISGYLYSRKHARAFVFVTH